MPSLLAVVTSPGSKHNPRGKPERRHRTEGEVQPTLVLDIKDPELDPTAYVVVQSSTAADNSIAARGVGIRKAKGTPPNGAEIGYRRGGDVGTLPKGRQVSPSPRIGRSTSHLAP